MTDSSRSTAARTETFSLGSPLVSAGGDLVLGPPSVREAAWVRLREARDGTGRPIEDEIHGRAERLGPSLEKGD